MSPIPTELTDLMVDEIVLQLVTSGPDKFNNFTYGAPITAQCQYARANKMSRDRSGREMISTAQMIMADPTIAVTADAKLTLVDGSHPSIIEVLAVSDEDGPYYLEIRA